MISQTRGGRLNSQASTDVMALSLKSVFRPANWSLRHVGVAFLLFLETSDFALEALKPLSESPRLRVIEGSRFDTVSRLWMLVTSAIYFHNNIDTSC